MDQRDRKLAELIRNKCIESARAGFMEASISGLCTEGVMEAAISAMQSLDLDQFIKEADSNKDPDKKAFQ